MNNYEDWAQLVAKKLEHESSLLAAIDKEEVDDAAASEAFERAVLKPFLPENFGIGAGRIVDAYGNYSEYLEIIVYNRNFPRIGMRGTHSAYLYESVVAAFSIRAKFVRKTFFDALDSCASLARLETNADTAALVKLAAKNGLKAGPNKTFVHQDPLRTARFELIGRPLSFVFGFSGFKYSYRQLQENIELWLENRAGSGIPTPMKSLPAVIATQGCFAWRNAAPLALSNREMLGIGTDDAPVRLIVLQLLYLLNRRLRISSDGYGLKPSLNAYLSQFSVPKFEVGVGNVAEVVKLTKSKPETPPEASAAKPAAVAEKPKQAVPESGKAAPDPKPAAPASKPASAAPQAKTGQAEASAGVFDKPSPFAAAPKPQEPARDASEPARWSAPRAPLGSAPIPQSQESDPPAPEPDRAPARAPLGSAPVPQSQESAPAAQPEPAPAKVSQQGPASSERPRAAAAAKVIPPKPPVDIDLGSGDDQPGDAKAKQADENFENTLVIPSVAETSNKPEPQDSGAAGDAGTSGKQASAEQDFESTVIIPPDAGASTDSKSKKSSDEFIARVKKQLSSSEPVGDGEKDFSSTIPQ